MTATPSPDLPSDSGRSVAVTPLNLEIGEIDHATPTPPPAVRARAHLRLAHAAPRCAFTHDTGARCGSPALNGRTLCYHHARRAAAPAFDIPSIDDPASLHCALQQVLSALFSGAIGARAAGVMLYGLQLASNRLEQSPAAPPQTAPNHNSADALRFIIDSFLPKDRSTPS